MKARDMADEVWMLLERSDREDWVDATLTPVDGSDNNAVFYIRTLDGTFSVRIVRVDK